MSMAAAAQGNAAMIAALFSGADPDEVAAQAVVASPPKKVKPKPQPQVQKPPQKRRFDDPSRGGRGGAQQPYQQNLNLFHCETCDISCTDQGHLDMHLKGKQHAKNLRKVDRGELDAVKIGEDIVPEPYLQEYIDQCPNPLIGLEFVSELQMGWSYEIDQTDVRYLCALCDTRSKGGFNCLQHVQGVQHRRNYIKIFFSSDPAVISECDQPQGSSVTKAQVMAAVLKYSTIIEELQGRKPIRVTVDKEGDEVKKQRTSKKEAKFKPQSKLNKEIQNCSQPCIGLAFVKEYIVPGYQPQYICYLCGPKLEMSSIMSHITGIQHRKKYIKIYYPGDESKVTEVTPRSEFAKALTVVAKEIQAAEGLQKVDVLVDPGAHEEIPLRKAGQPTYTPNAKDRRQMKQQNQFQQEFAGGHGGMYGGRGGMGGGRGGMGGGQGGFSGGQGGFSGGQGGAVPNLMGPNQFREDPPMFLGGILRKLVNLLGVDQISSPEECRLALRATNMLTDAVAQFMSAEGAVLPPGVVDPPQMPPGYGSGGDYGDEYGKRGRGGGGPRGRGSLGGGGRGGPSGGGGRGGAGGRGGGAGGPPGGSSRGSFGAGPRGGKSGGAGLLAAGGYRSEQQNEGNQITSSYGNGYGQSNTGYDEYGFSQGGQWAPPPYPGPGYLAAGNFSGFTAPSYL